MLINYNNLKLSNFSFKILISKCTNEEPNEDEELEADLYASMIPHYKPLDGNDSPKVTFSSAISLVNR